MKYKRHAIRFISLVALTFLLSIGNSANAQERPAFPREEVERARREEAERARRPAQEAERPAPQAEAAAAAPLGCRGPIAQVLDVADEGVRFTSANYFASPGGGEGGRFDKTPLLSTRLQLARGSCLNAHLSAIVGGRATYNVASLTMFQVTLTHLSGPPAGPHHMVGHYHTPFGIASPAVALEAERDIDMLGANFFQRVGTGPHDVPPGMYRVDVWWSGAGPGGAIGAAFVLKLYLR